MNNTLLATYIADVRAIRDSGRATTERSYYPALVRLFDAVGGDLKPPVTAIHDIKAQGDGNHPDFLLRVASTGEERAVVEAKGTGDLLNRIIESEQVRRYLKRYGLCLVTNLREFALTRLSRANAVEIVMTQALANDEATFWNRSARQIAAEHGEAFHDFLIDVLTWAAPINRPNELAAALARHAREALRRLERQPADVLNPLRDALNKALGVHFEGSDGEKFFRSTLVQTLFYGLFSGWVALQQSGQGGNGFRWKDTSEYLGLPLIAELFDEIAKPMQLKALDLRDPVQWAEATLNRTDWANFAQIFNQSDAINYFYEPFLEAFDPDLRKELGVWYTPPEIVRYMVARVDTVLREELKIANGLADERVIVLDPCCGTGAYLVETLRLIAHKVEVQQGEALVGATLRKAATERIFGFEIMPAPFIVAHLQIGMLLTGLNVALQDRQRAGVYLTNALTGWMGKMETDPLPGDDFPKLKLEAVESLNVKRKEQILVIIGNPPYNGFAGVAVDEERALTDAYRTPLRAPQPQGQGLNDLYVRFFRMAERRIVDGTGKGVVCFISNYSWLDGLSFTGMRERYLDAFDCIWIDNLNGDRYRTGKLTPDGKPDPSVFSTELSREGIQVGTAIATLARREKHVGVEAIDYRNLWGITKRQQLANPAVYQSVTPPVKIGFPFVPTTIGADYLTWPKLPELFPASFPGVKTSRDDVVVDIDKERLVNRMKQYFDPAMSHEEMRRIAPGAMENSARFQAETVRDYLRKRGLLEKNVVRYCYRPLDMRWLYWEPETKLLDEKRADYFPHVFEGNICLVSQQKPRRDWSPPQVIGSIGCLDLMDRGASCFPIRLRRDDLFTITKLDGNEDHLDLINLSDKALEYLSRIQVFRGREDSLFYHAIAIMHAPGYRTENAGALRQDWPRIPLPPTAEQLLISAELGKQITALFNVETPVPNVTNGDIRPELANIGIATRIGGGSLADDEYRVMARWGIRGNGGVTMPSTGRMVLRDYTSKERATWGERSEFNERALGAKTYDVYLNDAAYWRNIPLRVWEYTIGGYQVIKKWLSYREFGLLGRPLKPDEVGEVTNMVRRIAALLLLEETLDANYAAVKLATVPLNVS